MGWNWKTLGEEVERARRACVASGEPGHAEAARRFHQAFAAAWPPHFFEQLERCKHGDPSALEEVLQFVEASPRFFRTGYTLQYALRWLARPPRSDAQSERIREIVLAAVTGRLHLPFRSIPSLARAVANAGLRTRLLTLAAGPDAAVRNRAIAVLDRLPGPPWNLDRERMRRADDRAGAMCVTAQRVRSATLIRRVLAIDPGQLGTRGRSYLAVAFEFAMNWALLTDDELLEIARRIDGPEMEPVWRFALGRSDGPGDRARWLLRQLRRP